MLVVSGIANTFPVFFPPLLDEFGGSRAALALAVSLIWLTAATLGPVAGHLVVRSSPRLVVVIGLGATAAGLAAATLAPTLPAFVAALGVGGGIGVGLTGMVTQAAVIADAYTRRRGFATGIALSGSMAGYVLATPAHWAIVTVGWRGTLAGYVGLVLLLVPFVLRLYPARLTTAGAAAGGAARDRPVGAIVRTVPFWALAVVFALAPLVGYVATLQHALYFPTLGFSAAEAAVMLAIGGVLSTFGRALAGLAADRFGAPVTGLVSLSLSLAGTVCLAATGVWPSRALAYAYVLLVFAPLGTRATIVSLLVPRLASPARFGAVFGLLAIGNNVGAGIGPVLSGALWDVTGSYLVVFVTAAALLVVAIVALVVFLRTTPGPAGGVRPS
jgi:MFS family permease